MISYALFIDLVEYCNKMKINTFKYFKEIKARNVKLTDHMKLNLKE